MSNPLNVEVMLQTPRNDQTPMVLILASDDYGQTFRRWEIEEFLEKYDSSEDLEKDVLTWEEFESDSDVFSIINVEFFDEVRNECTGGIK